MLNICSSVHDLNQSTIYRGSDWTSQRAKEFLLKLKASERNVSEESAPEDTSSEARLSEASHQKPLHQSWQSTVYEVYNH